MPLFSGQNNQQRRSSETSSKTGDGGGDIGGRRTRSGILEETVQSSLLLNSPISADTDNQSSSHLVAVQDRQHATERRSSASTSSSSKRRTVGRFLSSSTKHRSSLPFSPSPTGSKSSSAETTATQSSLASSHPPHSNSGSAISSPEVETPPPPPPIFSSALSSSASSPPSKQENSLTGSVSRRITTKTSPTSAFRRVIKEGIRASSGRFINSNNNNKSSPGTQPGPSQPTGDSATSAADKYLLNEVPVQGQSVTHHLDKEFEEDYHPTVTCSSLNHHHIPFGGESEQEKGMIEDTSQGSDYFQDSIGEMKRSQAEMTGAAHQTTDMEETHNGISTLPPGLGDLCLANMGLPFLLFDSSERLVYVNEPGREAVAGLTNLSGTWEDVQNGINDEQNTRQAGPGIHTSRQRRKHNDKTSISSSHPSASASTSRPSQDSPPLSQSSSRPIASYDIFSHSAFDDIGFATAKLLRDPSSKPFSLSRTMEESGIVGQSYTDSSTVPPSTIPSQATTTPHSKTFHTHDQHHQEVRHSSLDKKRDSRSSVRSTMSTGDGINAAAGDGIGPPRVPQSRLTRTRTSTDGWIGLKREQCQPFLRLCGSDGKTWWRSNLSCIPVPAQPTEFYYAVLLFQPVIHEIMEITPCDDVSSIRSLASATTPAAGAATAATVMASTRPPFNRMPSDPPIISTDVNVLLERIEEDRPATIPLEFYKAAVECMPQILFTSGRDGIVSYLNPQWYSYTGWDMKTPSREMWADVFHPSDVGIAVDKYSEAIRAGKDIHLQYRVKNKHDQYRWMIARGTCIRDDDSGKITGFVCTLTDGQELIDAQQKAVQTQQYVSTVLKASAITLIVVDTTRKVVMFEGYTEALDKLGVTSEEAMGRLLEDAWPDLECAEQAQAMLAQQGEVATVPEREFATTVGPSHFRYRLVPLYEARAAETTPLYDHPAAARHLTGLAIVCTDISAMVHAEMALVQSQKERAELAAREKAAQEASRLKTIFVTSLSHEIRTPISGMLGISELLLDDESLSPKHQSLVKKQLHAGEVLLQLVSMVLDLGKMEANKLDLEKAPFLISDLMKDLDIFASLADAKGIYFERILDVREDCPLVGDRLRLAQVLSNFISNSVKFTAQGGITLRVEQEERDNDCLIKFQLEDTGPGIDKETLPHLFKPFHQGNVTIARRFGGSGLGLSIAKTLTELMGGTVSLESTLGVGTTVRLAVPLPKQSRPLQNSVLGRGRSTDEGSQAQEVASEEAAPLQLVDRRQDVSILIAEDNALLQEVYQGLVRKMHFGKVRIVEDGVQAIEEIGRELPHVVLMDIEMPRMNGPDAVRIIRSHAQESIRSVKIIALTANAVSGDKERFLAMGMDMYLSKPVRASKLEEAILECLQGL